MEPGSLILTRLSQVGVRGDKVIVLGVEKRSVGKLQEERTVRKICLIDEHVMIAFAGLNADARILVDRARVECQSHKLTLEDPVSIEYITRFIARLKQKYTISNGRRPFGISVLIAGFDEGGSPRLFQTDPSGVYHEWKANSTGKSGKTVLEYLEKQWNKEIAADEDKTIKLAIRSLLEVVQGKANMEIAVMRHGVPMTILNEEQLDRYVKEIEAEKEEAEKKSKEKKAPKA